MAQRTVMVISLLAAALAASTTYAQQGEQPKPSPSHDRPMMQGKGMMDMDMMHRMDEMMTRCNDMMKSAAPKDAPERKG